ncbi:MAG: ABC transporter substrate-binding protein [Acidimicrobiales bacterium]
MSRRPHRRRRRPAALVAVLALLALVAAACGDDRTASNDAAPTTSAARRATPDDEPVAVRIGYVPATATLPLQVAEAKGLFERNDLDVTLTEVPDSSKAAAGLGSQFDIVLSTAADLIRDSQAGLDLVEVAGNTISTEDNPYAQIVTRADTGITEIDQLEGRTIGTSAATGVVHAATLYWAMEEGAEPESIKAVEASAPDLPVQLQAKQVDAVQALEPLATQLVGAGQVSIGEPFSAIAKSVSTNFWVAQRAWAEENRDAVTRFVDSLEQAQNFIDQSPDEARQMLQGYAGLAPDVAATVPLPTFDFSVKAADLAAWAKVLREVEQLEGEVDTAKLVLAAP